MKHEQERKNKEKISDILKQYQTPLQMKDGSIVSLTFRNVEEVKFKDVEVIHYKGKQYVDMVNAVVDRDTSTTINKGETVNVQLLKEILLEKAKNSPKESEIQTLNTENIDLILNRDKDSEDNIYKHNEIPLISSYGYKNKDVNDSILAFLDD
ncbi:hypothetical protein ACNRWW_03470 [Metabacillus sp. HB246100]